MPTAQYAIPAAPPLLVHELLDIPKWLADYDEVAGREFNIADAMAASGDYFITLATRLDKLAQGMQPDSAEQIEIEHIIKTLFYLHEHYDVIAKYKRS